MVPLLLNLNWSGGLMMIRLPNVTADFIDCRETAQKLPHVTCIKRIIICLQLVDLLGEIHRMKLAHEKYGKLPWKQLFEPSIKLSLYGSCSSRIGFTTKGNIASPEPTGGLALIFILNLLEGYNMSQIGLDGINL
ncbi:gamma-glutamyltranspeptidase [Gigaspora margarita]|uniref:Gamma-glutamyltranspeptidase n=1 Tax=Gigaspora margarita TaxID=4874 RepID=A0A8H4ESG2_GIGMA|nr:gamma-glutamyltranspeptidase [Gigaspora margarita]